MKKNIIGDGNQPVLFLHGSKTFYNSLWMVEVSKLIDLGQYRVILPEFPKNLREKNQVPMLAKSLEQLVKKENLDNNLILIGKSLGAKVAVEYCQKFAFKTLILLGYPFAPPEDLALSDRVQKLNNLSSKLHIIQGSEDVYGNKKMVENLDLLKNIELHWIRGGDHNFFQKNENRINKEVSLQIQKFFSSIL